MSVLGIGTEKMRGEIGDNKIMMELEVFMMAQVITGWLSQVTVDCIFKYNSRLETWRCEV